MTHGAFEFYIDIEDGSGNKLGPGPITSAAKWTYTARMDRSGSFAFELPASDPMASFVQRKRKARAWAKMGGTWTDCGAGVIDHIERKPGPDGLVWLVASGDDEIRELAGRSVGWLELASASAGITHAAALTAIGAAVATGWTLTPAAAATNNYVYARFAGESVLASLVGVAQKTQTHFYRSGPRALTFASSFTSSNVRAIQASGDLVAETCAIVDLTERIETFDLLTRIVPLGAGNGEARLTLAASSRSAPSGYTVNKPANYLQHTASVTSFGVIDAPWIEFKDVRPISNTDADLQAAADMLFDQALKELTRRAVDMQVATYAVTLAGCSKLLRPLQSLRLVYRDVDSGIDVDQDVNILAATWEVTTDGVQTTAVELSSSDLWPQDDVGAVVERMNEGTVYQAHPQLNANAYVIAYTKHLDDAQANPAQFRFRFDQEVTQLTRVCFDFQLLPLESTVKSVGSSTPTTEASGNHTHNVTLDDHTHSLTVANHTHNVTVAAHTHSVTPATHTHTVTVAGHTHDVTVAAHAHTVTVAGHDHTVFVADHTHNVTVLDHQHSVTVSDHTHNVTLSNHDHALPVEADPNPTGNHPFARIVYYDVTDSNLYFEAASGSGFTTGTDGGGGTTVTSASGGGQTPTSGAGGGQTVSSAAGGSQLPTSSSGGGQTPTSSSAGGSTPTTTSGGGQTPTSGSGGGTTVSSASGGDFSATSAAGGGFTQSSGNGGGTTASSASGGSHTHTVTAAITTIYGVFRDAPGNVFTLGDLEYSLDGSTWYFFIPGVNGYASLGGGWNRVDLTGLVQNPVNFRPVASNNLLQIRRRLTGSAVKRCTIDAQMSIRTVIQSIAFSG